MISTGSSVFAHVFVFVFACVCVCVYLHTHQTCGHLSVQDTVKANEDRYQKMRSRDTETMVLFFRANVHKL